MTTPEDAKTVQEDRRSGGAGAKPLRRLFDLFSSVRFGIILLSILFVYCTIGSAGILYPIHPNLFHPDSWVHEQMRQWRFFEMTEFEWFHWWPFDVLMVLICTTLVVTTIRRIPLKPVNYGVWIIHTGVIVLCVGSVMYFGTKVEGDAPIVRRSMAITLVDPERPGEALATASLVAMPGNRAQMEHDGRAWNFDVLSIDPSWELLSGEDAGERTYSVNLLVDGPDGRFIRQLLAGYPEYTEDMVITEDPTQPMKRAIKEIGRTLVDDSIQVELDYESQGWFYLRNDLAKSFAVYLRKPGELDWVERPIHGMPLYNDYLSSEDDAWLFPGGPPPVDPLDITVSAVSPDDPAPGMDIRITGYLRYAMTRTRYKAGPSTAPINPMAWLTLSSTDGASQQYQLSAMDPRGRTGDNGLVAFRFVQDQQQLESLRQPPSLTFQVEGIDGDMNMIIDDVQAANPALEFTPVGDSGYSYRVIAVQDDIILSERVASVAIIEIKTPGEETIRRWVFSDPSLTRDVTDQMLEDPTGHSGPTLLDETITVSYQPGSGNSLLMLVAGPDPNQLRLLDALDSMGQAEARVQPISVGVPVPLSSGSLSLLLTEYLPRAVQQSRPVIAPPEQRNRDARELFSQVQVRVPGNDPVWLEYHQYPFRDRSELLRRQVYNPSLLRLEDGTKVELMFSRQRLPLPTGIALEEFILTTHQGGYTGQAGSIRNYTSMIRFMTDAGWTNPVPVSVNEPVEWGGYSYFQSQWDPPEPARFEGDRASMGLNYTVLGVGNRHGVWTQLAGCIIATIGMIYAFYIKPIIKRRQRLEHAQPRPGGTS